MSIKIVNETGRPRDTKVFDENGNLISGVYKIEFKNIDVKSALVDAIVHFRGAKFDVSLHNSHGFLLKDSAEFGDEYSKYKKIPDIYSYDRILKRIERESEKPDCKICKDVLAMNGKTPSCEECVPFANDDELMVVEAFPYLKGCIDKESFEIDHVSVIKYIEWKDFKQKSEVFRIICDLLIDFNKNRSCSA